MANNNYKELLDQLLSEHPAANCIRAHNAFDATESKIRKDGIILYGCGGFGKTVLKGLRKIGIEPLGFTESNPKMWGAKAEGVRIFSPEEAIRKFPDAVFMLTIWSDVYGHPLIEVKQILHTYLQVEVVSFFSLFWKYPDVFLPYFSIDLPVKSLMEAAQIKECFSLFKDALSQKEFIAQIRLRLWADHSGLTESVSFPQYFPDDLYTNNPDEVFVDCGAFDGDTLKNFLAKQNNQFSYYYGFEPDPVNFGKLRDYVAQLPGELSSKISVGQYGVSDTRKTLKFSSDGNMQSAISENGNISVDCISIDEYITNHKVSFIKLDVEGAEPDVISGAKKTIKNNLPVIAISVYHQYNHLWTLPLAIKHLSDDYEFYLRPHCKASFDLLCYAIPKHRLIEH